MLYDIRWYMRSIIWYNMIWYEMIWCNITWYHIIYLIMWYHLMMYDSIWYKYVTTCASRPPSLDVSLSRSQGSDVEFAGESPSIAPTETALCGQGGRFFEPSQILGGSFLELVMVMMGGGQLFFGRILVCFLKWTQGNADKKRWGRISFHRFRADIFSFSTPATRKSCHKRHAFTAEGSYLPPFFKRKGS